MSLDSVSTPSHRPHASRILTQTGADDAAALQRALRHVQTTIENEEESGFTDNDFIKSQLEDMELSNENNPFTELDKDAQDLANIEIQRFSSPFHCCNRLFPRHLTAVSFYCPVVNSLECQIIRDTILHSRYSAATAHKEYTDKQSEVKSEATRRPLENKGFMDWMIPSISGYAEVSEAREPKAKSPSFASDLQTIATSSASFLNAELEASQDPYGPPSSPHDLVLNTHIPLSPTSGGLPAVDKLLTPEMLSFQFV